MLFLGCDKHRDLTEYELDENSFDTEAILKIEQETGIDLPDSAKGVRFYHIPPVDPIVFAKIKIPAESERSLKNQIDKLKFNDKDFPKDFANQRCKWWPSSINNAVMSKQAFNNGYYIELYLVKEKKDDIIFIKYFKV